MASSATNPDTLVTLKVNIEGSNRRFKLPLRDLGANTLPDKLRALLQIPESQEAIFERYSDSAADFVTLDPNNASVYKQLYRAAKAKLKLRLKVTIIDQEDKEPVKPKQATVEDEVASPVAAPVAEPQLISVDTPLAPESEYMSPFSSESDKAAAQEFPSYGEYLKDLTFNFKNEVAAANEIAAAAALTPSAPAPVTTPPTPVSVTSVPVASSPTSQAIPVTRGAAARDRWYAELANLTEERRAALRANRHCPGASLQAHMNNYSVFCNSCNVPIPDMHYHCDVCDNGDYDLCQGCMDKGVSCAGENHWMIKRFVKNGRVINSVTKTHPQKASPSNVSKATLVEVEEPKQVIVGSVRTCNSCIQEYPESRFITCVDCEDFDLCIPCHDKVQHGHNPKHTFAPAAADAKLESLTKALLNPGRNVSHQAICDGCDKYIYGVRHKCLDCPDWDFCQTCVPNAEFIHPRHRFVPIYESIALHTRSLANTALHYGIYCDGPLCASKSLNIRGDRYKCAVCDDTDFCASCEASPNNVHNRTHPLIKFKTPIRNVSVTTMGDHDNGKPMPVMGDRCRRPISKSTETNTCSSANAATQVQTVAEVKPTPEVKTEKAESKTKEAPKEVKSEKAPVKSEDELVATFVRDAVPDGTILAPSVVFEQTWILRNTGTAAWPAGCTVKFVGGDNMCAVDPEHPASVHELVSAAESTTCYTEVAPGQEHGFTVLMRTPNKTGKVISYWRLTGPDGYKFGHRLWCDVLVEGAPAVVKEEVLAKEEEVLEKSQMIFPTLEKESPVSSVYEQRAPSPAFAPAAAEDDFVDFTSETHEDDLTEDGFLTDEEYDILDASDEEFLAEQGMKAQK
ncbi:hypothetical protein VE01_09271 [Pseudogymnoascus verrucosus]|uniref:ZZ-type domain-containing protein n=1 Tax=Pseudogymnoascus verrucosus TaxID=342668 RepID=A0A1B8G997_9PEZI|nr:uncharacterized protein VE01_09271 [Pseudogymnoascus verrucosus]OBT92409.1 hypothetical protein VE01_09271 [Pseudogymnoascus verrucosus]